MYLHLNLCGAEFILFYCLFTISAFVPFLGGLVLRLGVNMLSQLARGFHKLGGYTKSTTYGSTSQCFRLHYYHSHVLN